MAKQRTEIDLFEEMASGRNREPLAARMRPRTLDEFAGQSHILGPGRLLRRAIEIDQLSSLIFYGPPGTGKTTLARIIAGHTQSHFMSINAVLAGVADIRQAIAEAQARRTSAAQKSILFVDEVHRFNKAQQDALLPHVENGVLVLIGATTENPYFEVNKALVSRSRIFELRSLTEGDLDGILQAALEDDTRGFGNQRVTIDADARAHLTRVCGGDARSLLNALELAVETEAKKGGEIHVTLEIAEESIQKQAVLYDKDGDAHYDIISAFIKSVRGSDPDAALYWMARMLLAGEDPRFLFRRMVILAAEDIGLAAPEALGQVMAAANAFDYVGMPEGRFHLAQACLLLCNAPKSNSTLAFFEALSSVEKERQGEVPNHLKDGNRDKEDFGHGKGYKYPHAFTDHWVAQQYLPDALKGRVFYRPSNQGAEAAVSERVEARREAALAAMLEREWSEERACDGEGEQAWRQRMNRAEQAAWLRDKMFAAAPVERDHLVLDLGAGSGLMTWEALRKARGGGVVSVLFNRDEAETLREMASRLDSLSRPVVGCVEADELEKRDGLTNAVRKFCDGEPSFERIYARHVLGKVSEPKCFFAQIEHLLAEGGTAVLFEFAFSKEQRLSDFCRQLKADIPALDTLAELEDAYFQGSGDARSRISRELIRDSLTDGLLLKELSEPELMVRRKVRGEEIRSWFSDKSRLGSFLMKNASAEQVKQWAESVTKSLAGRNLEWKRPGILTVVRRQE